MSTPTTTIDYNLAVQEIGDAWQNCQKPNLEFGKTLCKWRDLFGQKHTGPQTKGTGLAQILSQLNINEGVAYYWIYKYEVSIGMRDAKPAKIAEIVPNGTSSQAPAIASGNFWEDLHDRLNPLVPSFSDGAEHKTVVMLQQALTEPANTQAEKNFRKYVIGLLNKISKTFSEYAMQLEMKEVNAELVQVECPTTSGEMAYQIDHSAPNYEAAP